MLTTHATKEGEILHMLYITRGYIGKSLLSWYNNSKKASPGKFHLLF